MSEGDDVGNGIGEEDVFVDLFRQFIDRLDRQEKKIDRLLEAVAELREEQDRQGEVQAEFAEQTAVLMESAVIENHRLADYQFRMHNIAREVYGDHIYEKVSAFTVVELLKLLTSRIDDAAVDAAFKKAWEKGRGRQWMRTMVEFEEAREHQRVVMPYVRDGFERDWTLNRDGKREARLVEREEQRQGKRERGQNGGRER